jgi:sugar O-acyltransferase (sialic acid O-acetyltransferase NeuD family)
MISIKDQPKNIVIIGAGEQALLAYEYFTHDSPHKIAGFAVESKYREADNLLGLPIVDFEIIEQFFPSANYTVHVAISSTQLNRVRSRLFTIAKNKGYQFTSYISSRAFVWHNVEIGENAFILEHNTIQPFCKIGHNTVLWSGNHIGHRTVIGDHCFISSHVVISGFCHVGNYCFMGVNSSLANNLSIASDNFIAMGAQVTKSTIENLIYKGAPAEPSKLSAKRFCKVVED